jgi:hypothetical protein
MEMHISKQPNISKNYKWITLSNTTLGVFMASLAGSSMMLALPVIFRGIQLDPLAPGSSNYLLLVY